MWCQNLFGVILSYDTDGCNRVTPKLDVNKLEFYKKNKLLVSQNHPFLPLTIWNYSHKVQYEGLWDEITKKCRALVTDFDGNIVAKSFDKFFNLEEEDHLSNEPFVVYEKLDGSLILLFYYKDELVLSSKGSFISEHAIEAKRILNKYKIDNLDKNKTYCFELIAPWNRIVCSYDKEDLVLLAKFDVFGNEYEIENYLNFNKAKKYNFSELSSIKSLVGKNKEGFVVRFDSGKRIKIKGIEYVKLHRIISNLNEIVIYEELKNKGSISDLICNIPDEYHAWTKDIEKKLINKYDEIYKECNFVFKKLENRKETAEYFMKQKYPQVLFAMLDDKDLKEFIWKIIKKDLDNTCSSLI